MHLILYMVPQLYNKSIYHFPGKKGEPEKEEAPPGEAIIPTLPDVKMCAAKAIGRSAKSGKFLIHCVNKGDRVISLVCFSLQH